MRSARSARARRWLRLIQEPLPTAAALDIPEDVADLEGWLVGQLRVVPPNSLAAAISRAERVALQRFPDRDVVAAMRRVVAMELTR